jgi:class 3 adenylate cyclase
MADYIDEMSALITHAIRFYGGDPFKFTGDGYLAWFESASDCLNAAQKIQRDIQLRNLTVGGRPAGAVRVVIHTADLIVTEDDLLGDGLAIVSRLEKMTPASAIYVTETTFGICKRAEFEFEYVDTFEVRGLSNPIRVYELKYQNRLLIEENLCILVSDIKRFSRLMLSIQPTVLEEYLLALHRLHRHAAKTFSGVLSKIMGGQGLDDFLQRQRRRGGGPGLAGRRDDSLPAAP